MSVSVYPFVSFSHFPSQFLSLSFLSLSFYLFSPSLFASSSLSLSFSFTFSLFISLFLSDSFFYQYNILYFLLLSMSFRLSPFSITLSLSTSLSEFLSPLSLSLCTFRSASLALYSSPSSVPISDPSHHLSFSTQLYQHLKLSPSSLGIAICRRRLVLLQIAPSPKENTQVF